MAEARLNSIFQVKDPYLELRDTEAFLAKAQEFRKEPPTIQETIFRKTAYDPYYHKNIFNKSQTYHHIDYIIHSTQEPFHRPEITEKYVTENREGTKTFFPSFLKGSYIDVEDKERVFESLLLRDIEPSPSEEEILQARVKACMEEEQTIAFYQNEVQDRIASLAKTNPHLENTFKNYFKNLCDWMITGKLKENMNDKTLRDEKGIIEGPEYNFAAIPNLGQIHAKIEELHRTFDINNVLELTNKGITTTKNQIVIKRKEDLAKMLAREEFLKKLKEEKKRADKELRLSKEKKKKEAAEKIGINKLQLKNIGEKYTDKYLNELKKFFITVEGVNVSWDSLVGKKLGIEIRLENDFLNTLKTNLAEIDILRKQLKQLNTFLFENQTDSNLEINIVKDLADELKYADAYDNDDDTHFNNLMSYSQNLTESIDLLIEKRKSITSYSFALRWYKTDKKGIIDKSILSDIRLASAGKYGDIFYSRGITRDDEILVSYNVYDEGTLIKSVKTHPIPDLNTDEIYFYRIFDSKGKEIEVEFMVQAVKRGKNTNPTLRFSLQEKTA